MGINMRRVILYILTLALTFSFSSCSGLFNDLYRQAYSRLGELHDDDAINLYIPQLLEAINKKDTYKVKALLSYEVRDKYTDDDVQALIDIFTGELENPCPKEWIDSSSLSGGSKYVATTSSDWVFISSDDSMYSIAFTIRYLDDYYPRNEGFEYICVFDKYREAYFNYYSETNFDKNKAIIVETASPSDLPEGYQEVRRINGNIQCFKPEANITRPNPVTKEAVKAFLNTNDNYNSFVAHFGEPNSKSWLFPAWEIGENQYITIGCIIDNFDEEGNELCASYEHINEKNTIYGAYISNQDKRTGDLWPNEN